MIYIEYEIIKKKLKYVFYVAYRDSASSNVIRQYIEHKL